MHPEIVRIPLPGGLSIPIYSYGLMLVLGFLSGLWLAQREAKRVGIDPVVISDMAIFTLIAGIAGARLFFVLQHLSDLRGRWLHAFFVQEGGLVYYGGLIGGIGVVAWFTRKHNLPVLKTLDVLAPAAALGLAFGRVGCFLRGCCYGKPAPNLPWAIRFPKSWYEETGYPVGTPVHPTELYAVLGALALCGVLLWIARRPHKDGTVFFSLGALYSVIRFTIEFFRGDNKPFSILGLPAQLTLPQWMSVGIFIACVGLIVWRSARLETRDLLGEPEDNARRKEEKPKRLSKKHAPQPPAQRSQRNGT